MQIACSSSRREKKTGIWRLAFAVKGRVSVARRVSAVEFLKGHRSTCGLAVGLALTLGRVEKGGCGVCLVCGGSTADGAVD